MYFKFLFLFFILTSNCYAFSSNIIKMPVEKFIKTIGITGLEKSLTKSAKFAYSGGKLVAKRNETFFPNIKDSLGRSNIQRMEQGLAPIGKDGKSVELHHLKQKNNGIIMELTSKEHNIHSKILHRYKNESEIHRNNFNSFKKQYWKERVKDFNEQ